MRYPMASEWHECTWCGRRWLGGSSKLPICDEHAEELIRRAAAYILDRNPDPTLAADLRDTVRVRDGVSGDL